MIGNNKGYDTYYPKEINNTRNNSLGNEGNGFWDDK
jgi:hypothetical protein